MDTILVWWNTIVSVLSFSVYLIWVVRALRKGRGILALLFLGAALASGAFALGYIELWVGQDDPAINLEVNRDWFRPTFGFFQFVTAMAFYRLVVLEDRREYEMRKAAASITGSRHAPTR